MPKIKKRLTNILMCENAYLIPKKTGKLSSDAQIRKKKMDKDIDRSNNGNNNSYNSHEKNYNRQQ